MTRKLIVVTCVGAGILIGAASSSVRLSWRPGKQGSEERRADGANAERLFVNEPLTSAPAIVYNRGPVAVPRFQPAIRAVRPLNIEHAPATVAIYAEPIANAELAAHGLPHTLPLARISVTGPDSQAVWQVLGEQSVALAGRSYRILQVRIPRPAGISHSAASERSTSAEGDRDVWDIVFVIDNTYSGGPFLLAAQRAVSAVMREERLRDDIAIGIVLYRDYADGLYFGPRQEATLLLNRGRLMHSRNELLDLLRSVVPTAYGSDDYPEAVFDGLWVALRNIAWRTGSRRTMVWIGDSSSHAADSPRNPFHLTVAGIARAARELNVRLVPVCIDGAGGEAEQELHRRQAAELAAQTDGALLEFGDLAELPARLVSLHDNAESRWSIPETAESANTITGWTLAEYDGQSRFEFGWLLSSQQADFLCSELAGLATHLRLSASGRSNSQEALGTGPATCLFFSQPHDERWTDMLHRAGIPISSSALHRTQREFLEMTADSQRLLADLIHQQWLDPLSARLSDVNYRSDNFWMPSSLIPTDAPPGA